MIQTHLLSKSAGEKKIIAIRDGVIQVRPTESIISTQIVAREIAGVTGPTGSMEPEGSTTKWGQWLQWYNGTN